MVIVLLAHAIGGVWAVVLRPRNGLELTLLYAVPLAQASLLGFWVAWSAVRLDLRMPIAALGVIVAWGEIYHGEVVKAEPTIGEMIGLMLALQFLLVACYAVVVGITIAYRGTPSATSARSWQFTLAGLLIWTTELAVLLGFARMISLEWQMDVGLFWGGFRAHLFFGLANAAIAIPVAAVLALRRPWKIKLALLPLAVGLTAACLWYTERLVYGRSSIDLYEALAVIGAQAGYIAATLAAVRIAETPPQRECDPGIPG